MKQVFALGFFDGVHLGHQALLRACAALAKEQDAMATAVSFSNHPQSFFTKAPPLLINSGEERRRLLMAFGMNDVLELPVDEETMSMPWEQFFEKLCDLGAAGVVCGRDYRFGRKAEGDAQKLKAACEAAGIPCVIVPDQELDGIRVSSTHIRKLLEAGEMEQAVRFLGHPHYTSGRVVSGQQLGRTLGVPTANLLLPAQCVVPKLGAYACKAYVGEVCYPAVTNVGTRPTVDGTGVTVEPWILNFEGDLYGKELVLEFYKFLRPERKFGSLEELRTEIQKNAAETLKFFENP